MKIVFVIAGILVFFILPAAVSNMLAHTVGMMAALKELPVVFLDKIEPEIKMWSGRLVIWILIFWVSSILFFIFGTTFLMWSSKIFAFMFLITFAASIFSIRNQMKNYTRY